MFVDAPPTGAPAGSPVKPEPSPVIVPPVTLIPALAVIIPIASIFVTSSYVNVPAIPTVPLNLHQLQKLFPLSHDLHEKLYQS